MPVPLRWSSFVQSASFTQPQPAAPGTGRPAASGYRPEIQGLRAVAVLLVAGYHIWFGRVSGGVDVFLLLTGFLITGSLVRMVERQGRVDVAAFWTRLVKRLFPAASVVLVGVLAAAYLFLADDRWRDTIQQVVAAALYYENWWLATESVDYLARNDAASPVQHFWSLSIQGQFYLLWPALVALAAVLAARSGWAVRRAVFVAVAAVFAGSLGYSVLSTAANQQWAYFDTGARLWELALGGLLALGLPYIRLGRRVRIASGWVGLAALVSCGTLIPATGFPGYAALWPTAAAVLVIVAGDTGGRFAADRLLTWKPLHAIGDISYPLYLWHWPVLICYLAVTERTTPSLLGGGYVLGLSLALAAGTKWLVEDRVEQAARGRPKRLVVPAVGLACLLPVLTAAGGWSAHLAAEQRRMEALVADPANYPGAAALANGGDGSAPRDLPVYPPPAEAADDVPVTYEDGCNQEIAGSKVLTCAYGPDDADRTIALVGGSHAAHWFPALDRIARDNGWRVVNIIKGACMFTDAPQHYKGEAYTSCAEWNQGVMTELADLRPDAVFTTATTTSLDTGAGYGEEMVVDGYVEKWRELAELDIDVLAIRDTPRLGFDSASCVAEKARAECGSDRSDSLADESPLDDLTGVPDNVTFLDLTDRLCTGGRCPAVIGNVLVYWDGSHITTTYMRTLAPALEGELKSAASKR
ncbi:acyltransferase family protein [Nocardiopsis rhodophaea]|uniref:Acyltransferase family protein n=1 Tax=Nocardiopsis rhodophaea TaxID=280238 RepID=A0ABP5ELW7_9ACTN